MRGLHILAEFHACAAEHLLEDAGALAAACRAVCDDAGLTPVAETFHQFPGAGATGAVILAESHLTIHTWPELAAVTLDIYVCNFSQDNRAAAEAAYADLHAIFRPGNACRRDVVRGDVDLHHADDGGMR